MTKEGECLKALRCLYIAVDSSIADDVKRIVLEALKEAKNVSSNLPVMRSAFDAGYNNGFKDATGSSKPERKFEEWHQKHFA